MWFEVGVREGEHLCAACAPRKASLRAACLFAVLAGLGTNASEAGLTREPEVQRLHLTRTQLALLLNEGGSRVSSAAFVTDCCLPSVFHHLIQPNTADNLEMTIFSDRFVG